MALNAVMSALDTVFVRLVADEVHPLEIAFFRNLFSLITLFLILPRGERTLNGNGLWPLHGMRAVLKLVAMVTYFLAITMLPLALVTAIAFTMPLFVVLGSVVFLHENLGRHRLIALGAGFVGMLVILRPPGMEIGTGFALAVFSAVAFAGGALLMKVSSGRETPLRIVWCNLLITVPIALLVTMPVWVWPSPQALALMALQGIGGLFAQLSVARAMKLADASMVIPVDFLRLPIAALLGLALFGEPLKLWVLLGGTVIFAGVIYSARAESRLARLST
ncbi:EamA-like transporter family protein [Palleronia marisminoris]|uniref:Riboflavin transporter n=1 Tax=Palleronia marisminoris TaxID=315423 RepID=A0A1Y5SQV5_9RHOB|nr:DMT family transporter [Palleronia marisminoris]SFG92928.1 EamA-like transporter family protein [Palleronia marisminoris]SLN44976.1 Riboflavin transporter [Palleronia marisminoris]